MSEATPNGQRDSDELKELIRELESQIESVNAGLGKIRGTVARIAYASLGTATPPPSALWNNGVSAAPANRSSQTATMEAAPAPPAQPPAPKPAPESFITAPEHEAAPGFWTSVAEGASWPRASTPDAAPAFEPAQSPPHQAIEPSSWTGTPADPTPVAGSEPVHSPSQAPGVASPSGSSEWAEPDVGQDFGSRPDALPDEPEMVRDGVSRIVEAAQAEDAPAAGPNGATDPEAWMLEAAVEPAQREAPAWGAAETPSVVADANGARSVPPTAGGEMPARLSSGWPDESAWSQSFEWPAMKSEMPAVSPAPDASPEGAAVDVTDIVAQVRAELAAARAQGVELPVMDDAETETATGNPAEASTADDDTARRDEVSRAVAEMRAQIRAGDFDGGMRSNGFDDAGETVAGFDSPAEGPAGSEEDVREEVRRAVEAAREELSGIRGGSPASAEKPAFRLAAPGSIPDWSHMKLEQSGPPVVVMKDVEGRVELASVYETLNELGCGDGAALLNYTPHSVTVGLPISSQVPSKEQVAEAVEKVFGLASRVDSDGVRITVSIGEDPKRRSVA